MGKGIGIKPGCRYGRDMTHPTVRVFAALLATSVPTALLAAKPQAWLTSADHSRILTPAVPVATRSDASIVFDPAKRMQRIDGFGFALTGGSALLLQRMSPAARHTLLVELFGHGPGGMDVSWLRVSIGASDMDDHVFSYDDMASGRADPALRRFSLAPDERALIPTLREILSIAPGLPILASPWSPPVWMKTNGQVKGGTLRSDMDNAFARYLVAYVRGMAAHGVPIAAITLQNEPENTKNTPSMLLSEVQEAALIADQVGPAFRDADLATRIVAFDHNCDHPQYPLAILGDARAVPFVAGTGFHLYEGDASAMGRVHDAYPDKPVWLTEQMVIDDSKTGRATPVAEPLARVVLGSLANWASGVLLWNLAADPNFGPHTANGGCPVCEGAVTLDGDQVTRNVAYATIVQLSRFVPPGSRRIASTSDDPGLPNVAFLTPTDAVVLVVANPTGNERSVRVAVDDDVASYIVPAGGALTMRWPGSASGRSSMDGQN